MAHINLLPWRQLRRKEQQREFISVITFSAVLTGILVLYAHIHVNGMIEFQERRNEYLANEIKILDEKIADIKQLESTKKALLDRMNVIDSLQATRPGIVHLFDELARTLPEGTYLTSVKQNDSELVLTGKAESNARVSAYMRKIDASGWLADSRLEVIEAKEDEISRISDFTLQAKQSSPEAKARATSEVQESAL
ncbi:MAG: PilN domain-containing protein [Gammaproteobacteria bacterium]